MNGDGLSWREPILAIDFGTTYSSACLVPPGQGERVRVREPGGNYLWPSAVLATERGLVVGRAAADRKRDAAKGTYCSQFKRDLGSADPIRLGKERYRPDELMREVIAAMVRAASEELAVRAPGSELGRTVLTVPVSYAGDRSMRKLMFSVMESVVAGPVQLLPEPVAAAWETRPPTASGQRRMVLVYDFGGGTFDAALIEMGPGTEPHVLGMDSVPCGGKDIDADLARLLRAETAVAFGPASAGLSVAEAESRRYRIEAGALAAAEEAKRGLTNSEVQPAKVLTEAVRVTLEQLEAAARPYISDTIQCCRRLLTDPSHGKTVADLDQVLLVGGTTNMRLVDRMLRDELLAGLPANRRDQLVTPPPDRDLAVVLGAARWAMENDVCGIRPEPAPAGGSVLRWQLDQQHQPAPPGGGPSASLVHWHIARDHEYQPGEALARIRYTDGALWDLIAAEPGVLRAQLTSPADAEADDVTGVPVKPGEWIATTERW